MSDEREKEPLLRLLVLRTDGTFEFREGVPNALQSLQALVNGYIEVVYLKDTLSQHERVVGLANEEGVLRNMPFNPFSNALFNVSILNAPYGFAGDLVVLGSDPDSGEFCSLTDDDVARLKGTLEMVRVPRGD
jgi:hypothetical protein